GLRNRVTLRTDGGMRTGEDIVYAALLGAEEFNFGTAALIALGCVYVRQCHLNTCPVGVATLDERLRSKFKGRPENLVLFFNAVAQEVREIMARLGFRTVDEMVGRTECLRQREVPGHPKANTLDLSRMLVDAAREDPNAIRHATRERNDAPADQTLDEIILQEAKEAINDAKPTILEYRVDNTQRSIGTMVSGEIGYQYGEAGLPEGTLRLRLRGTAGQSLGAFLAPGLHIELVGEANDYVGKGMSGGEIVIRPPAEAKFDASSSILLGNTVLYGATGGRLFVHGRAGERFAVRNSGAVAVVEGVGDHGCEYMTNGVVVVLGPAGKNFGAGMTGGTAYVLDPEGVFPKMLNRQLVGAARVEGPDEVLRGLVEAHAQLTGSPKAAQLLASWDNSLAGFWKVSPLAQPAKPAAAEANSEGKPEQPASAASPARD
ncbi:MAG: glutamate synthase-related protein, partial [Terrimicrobiaceae bacterium]|nr:glutamate synthase-related protein [Terrimicrobiaceae bacterium]